MLYAVGKGGADLADTAYPAIGNEPVDDASGRLVTGPEGLRDEDLLFLGKVKDSLGLGGVCHESLFHQAGLALPYRLHRHVEMVGMRCGDIDQVHVRIVQQVSV